MNRYYCPYCSPIYQFHIERDDGVMICGQCGDPLVEKKIIKSKQIFAMISITAFIAPLIMMVLTFIDNNNDSSEQSLAYSRQSITFITNIF